MSPQRQSGGVAKRIKSINVNYRMVTTYKLGLGFEPSCQALRRHWSDVANALLRLRLSRDLTANILNQHWVRTGNNFPYSSPV
jgi:hypothetical protein